MKINKRLVVRLENVYLLVKISTVTEGRIDPLYKGWLLVGEEIYEPKLVPSKNGKKHSVIIKSKMYNFMYVDKMKI